MISLTAIAASPVSPDINLGAPGELIPFPTGRYAIPEGDMAEFSRLAGKEQERVKLLLTIFAKMEEGGVSTMSETLGFQLRNLRGFGASNLRTLFYAWKTNGWQAVVRGYNNGHDKLPHLFVEYFRALCECNGRSMKQAMGKLYRAWASGESIPGYGTWHNWFLTEYPDREFPAICPGIPKGWGKSNLYSLQPSKGQRALATKGFAAAKSHLLSIVRDPGKLLPLQLVVIDDFEIDQMCFYHDPITGTRGICRMAGIAAMDVATRRIIGLILKPRVTDDSGKMRAITRAEVRWLLFQVLKDHGVPKHGMTIMAENAAAAVTTELELTFKNLFGGLVAVTRTGVIDQAVIAGGFKDSGGKPWLKGWIESFFNLMHNVAAGMVPGNKGASYQLKPANLDTMVRVSERLIGTGPRDARLSDEQLKKARIPFKSSDELCDLYMQIFRIIEQRTDHEMLGFDEVMEWRSHPSQPPQPFEALAQLTEEEQCAVEVLPPRKQSPRERWDALYPRIERTVVADHALMVLLLTPRKGKIKGAKITFDHNGKGYTWLIDAKSTLATLPEGNEVLCYFDPTQASRAHVCQLDGRALGEVLRWGPVDLTDQAAVTEAERMLAKFYGEQLAIVRNRPVHQEAARQLAEDQAINAGLATEAAQLRNAEGVTKTLGRGIPAMTEGAVTPRGDQLAHGIVARDQAAALMQRQEKALQRAGNQSADLLDEPTVASTAPAHSARSDSRDTHISAEDLLD
jgi:hypothetical protein